MNILFILHTANNNGATNSVQHLILYLLQNSLKIKYLTLDNTELKSVSEDNRVSIRFNYNKLKSFKNLLRFILGRNHVTNYSHEVYKLSNSNYSILYVNTIVSLRLAIDIKKYNQKLKIILHLHEMETIIKQTFSEFDQYDEFISSYIVVSKFTKQYLLDLGISKNKIFLINECTAIPTVNNLDYKLKKEYNVVMLGEAHWRKGDDIFLLIVKQVIEINCEIHFYWIGKLDPYRKVILEQDINKLGISSNITFIEEVKNPQDYLAKMDLFMLTSREDPFPLAVIEAGMLGIPIICFEKATGLEDDILNVGGDVVPYLDIYAMSKSVIKFFENRESISLKKNSTIEYFMRFNPDKICGQIYDVLNQLV